MAGIGDFGTIESEPATLGQNSNRTKDGARNDVRRWRTIHCFGDQITYRVWTTGHKLELIFKNPTVINHETMSWRAAHIVNSKYRPHARLNRLLEVLELYAATLPPEHIMQHVFDPTKQNQVELTLHDHISLTPSGVFRGFASFHIYSNRSYGTAKQRPRHDLVEIAIPRAAGGGIADSPDLLRISEDTAIAMVIGILTVSQLNQESCVLIVNFLRTIGEGSNKTIQAASSMCGEFGNFYVGRLESTWLAAYPLQTLKSPVLGVPCGSDETTFFVFPLKYISRDRWQDNSQSPLFQQPRRCRQSAAGVLGLQGIQNIIAQLEPTYDVGTENTEGDNLGSEDEYDSLDDKDDDGFDMNSEPDSANAGSDEEEEEDFS